MDDQIDAQDEAVRWVRDRFNDPSHDPDARVLARIERDPAVAVAVKEMITRPAQGLRFRVDVGSPREPELATSEALARLNARLGLVGAQATPFDGDQIAGSERLWTVRVRHSHVDYVTFILTGPYGISSYPDGETMVEEVVGLSVGELEALHRCFQDTLEHLRAGLTRLQGETIPRTDESPAEMLRYGVEQTVGYIRSTMSRLEHIDAFVAREQRRR